MKKIISLIIIVLLLAGSYAIYQYFQAGGPQTPEFVRMENIKFSNAKLPPNMNVTFNSDIVINNPNPFSVKVSGLDFDVFVNGKKTTHISQNKTVSLKAEADATFPLSFKIPIKEKEVFKDLSSFLTGAWKKQAIDVKSEGTIMVKVLEAEIPIPFEYEETYTLKDYLK